MLIFRYTADNSDPPNYLHSQTHLLSRSFPGQEPPITDLLRSLRSRPGSTHMLQTVLRPSAPYQTLLCSHCDPIPRPPASPGETATLCGPLVPAEGLQRRPAQTAAALGPNRPPRGYLRYPRWGSSALTAVTTLSEHFTNYQ